MGSPDKTSQTADVLSSNVKQTARITMVCVKLSTVLWLVGNLNKRMPRCANWRQADFSIFGQGWTKCGVATSDDIPVG